MTQKNGDDESPDSVPTRHRAFCYITSQDHIVLIAHIDYPNQKLQIPGGTIEAGEEPAEAALREAEEETGFKTLNLVRLLGDELYDMREFGRQEKIHGWFYQFTTDGFELGKTWRHDELHAHGGGGPIRYELSWYPINDMPPTFGRDTRFISQLG